MSNVNPTTGTPAGQENAGEVTTLRATQPPTHRSRKAVVCPWCGGSMAFNSEQLGAYVGQDMTHACGRRFVFEIEMIQEFVTRGVQSDGGRFLR